MIHIRAKTLDNKITTWEEIQKLTRMKDIELMQNKEMKTVVNIQGDYSKGRSHEYRDYNDGGGSYGQRRNQWTNSNYNQGNSNSNYGNNGSSNNNSNCRMWIERATKGVFWFEPTVNGTGFNPNQNKSLTKTGPNQNRS